jgi:hypothetical protein
MSVISRFRWDGERLEVVVMKAESKSKLKAGFSIYLDGLADGPLRAGSTRPRAHRIFGIFQRGRQERRSSRQVTS